MKAALMGGTSAGVFNHVRYEAKSAVHMQGGYKAGYRLTGDDWNWSATKYDEVNEALEAAVKLAREAISMGEKRPETGSAS